MAGSQARPDAGPHCSLVPSWTQERRPWEKAQTEGSPTCLRTWGGDPGGLTHHHPPPWTSLCQGRNGAGPLSCAMSLATPLVPEDTKFWGPDLVGKAWGRRRGRSGPGGGGWVKLPQAGRREAGGWAQFVLGVKGEFFSKEFWERRQLEQAASHPSLSLPLHWWEGGCPCQPDLTLSSLRGSQAQDGVVGERTSAGLRVWSQGQPQRVCQDKAGCTGPHLVPPCPAPG